MTHRAHLDLQEVRDLVAAIANGTPYADIADAFGVSTRTVTAHAVRVGFNRKRAASRDVAPPPNPLAFSVPEWTDSAVCAQTDPEAFFPEKGGSTRHAKAVCATCPVQVECLDYALANDERFGIWGGLSERERRRIKHLQKETR